MTDPRLNIADRLMQHAAQSPDRIAITWPTRLSSRVASGLSSVASHGPVRSINAPVRGWEAWTFNQLHGRTSLYVGALATAGIEKGDRTILMVRPGPDFFALTFALLRLGAVPVLIDPGMGTRRLVQCLAGIGATAFVGIPLAHMLRLAHRRALCGYRSLVTVGGPRWWGGHSLATLCTQARDASNIPQAHTNPHDPAAILFTTGSTGPAKGVLYRHATFDAQVRVLQEQFGLAPGQVDVATFPLFALFDAALGVTAVIPDMDPTRPGEVNPRCIGHAVADHRATNMFASPALLNRVSSGLAAAELAHMRAWLGTLRRVLSAGAPVRPDVLERFAALLQPAATVRTPYGATEALPVAVIDGQEVLNETRLATASGKGICVGRSVGDIAIRIIRIDDGAIPEWSDNLCLPVGQIGEIVVRGSVVTTAYAVDAAATALAKISDGDAIWHRMGDVGYIDGQARLWMCGRKSHRVICESETLYTIPCESIFNEHPDVQRTALVGVGHPPYQTPVLCVELRQRMSSRRRAGLMAELAALGARHAHTQLIHTFLYHPRFPVDIRHNAKIGREQLARWAMRRLARRHRAMPP